MTFAEQYDFLQKVIGISEEALDLAYGIGEGSAEEITNRILFYYTGYRSIEQYIECEMEE